MKDSGFKLNKEKVFGTIISFAIILTLGYGIYSVAVNSGRKENQENIVHIKAADLKDQLGQFNTQAESKSHKNRISPDPASAADYRNEKAKGNKAQYLPGLKAQLENQAIPDI